VLWSWHSSGGWAGDTHLLLGTQCWMGPNRLFSLFPGDTAQPSLSAPYGLVLGSLLDDEHWHSVLVKQSGQQVDLRVDRHSQHIWAPGAPSPEDLDAEVCSFLICRADYRIHSYICVLDFGFVSWVILQHWGVEPRVLCMLGKYSTTEPHPNLKTVGFKCHLVWREQRNTFQRNHTGGSPRYLLRWVWDFYPDEFLTLDNPQCCIQGMVH
jgi:hypothetical protein